jgi:galactokinase
MAIDRSVWVALRPRDDGRVLAFSSNAQGEALFSLHALRPGAPTWAEYVKGVAWALQEAGYSLAGWEGVVEGDVPIGAGLSSSAALELACARAFSAASEFPWEAREMATLAQRAESKWVGVNCGIMDQMISALGQEGHALLIDCRSLGTAPAPLPPDVIVVILDTMTRRGLVDSAYNERRAQCELAARLLGVPALRDLTMEGLQSDAGRLDPIVYRRACHVVSENSRTLQAVEALTRRDSVTMGRLMTASHRSLCDDFEVSSVELDMMVHAASSQPGCYGARMTGAGFGGSVVAFVDASLCSAFAAKVSSAYLSQTGIDPDIYVCKAVGGAELVAVL